MYSIIYDERIALICMQQEEAWFSPNAILSSITSVHITLICYVSSDHFVQVEAALNGNNSEM